MPNYKLKVNLLKLQGAFIRDLQGKTATKKCIIIPLDDNGCMFLGQKGCYLNLTAIELSKHMYGDTHCVKGDISKDKWDAMSEEERKAQQILGGMTFLQPKPLKPQTGNAEHFDHVDLPKPDDDMPF